MKTKRFKEEDYSKYFPNDTESDNTTTNRYRFYRVHYWAQKLAEDSGAELLIFGYFPNKKDALLKRIHIKRINNKYFYELLGENIYKNGR